MDPIPFHVPMWTFASEFASACPSKHFWTAATLPQVREKLLSFTEETSIIAPLHSEAVLLMEWPFQNIRTE